MTDADQDKREDPQFEVDDANDLATLLRRAANWAERDVGADVIAAEFRGGLAFVEDEILVDGTTAVASHVDPGPEGEAND
jgi:hypothetical protein